HGPPRRMDGVFAGMAARPMWAVGTPPPGAGATTSCEATWPHCDRAKAASPRRPATGGGNGLSRPFPPLQCGAEGDPALSQPRRFGPKNAFDHVGVPARLVFYAGVFCVFAPLALVWDLASPKGLPWTSLALWSVYSGAIAVGWAYAFTRNLRYLWIHVPV